MVLLSLHGLPAAQFPALLDCHPLRAARPDPDHRRTLDTPPAAAGL